MHKKIILTLLILSTFHGFGQSVKLNGTIINQANTPIAFVKILLMND